MKQGYYIKTAFMQVMDIPTYDHPPEPRLELLHRRKDHSTYISLGSPRLALFYYCIGAVTSADGITRPTYVTVTNAICMHIRPQTDSLFLYLLTINQSSPLDFCAWRKATSTMSHPVFQINLRGINCQPIPERIQIIITEQLPCFMKDLSLTMNTWIPGYGPLGQLSDHRQHTEVCTDMYTCNRRFETLHGSVIVRPAVPF